MAVVSRSYAVARTVAGATPVGAVLALASLAAPRTRTEVVDGAVAPLVVTPVGAANVYLLLRVARLLSEGLERPLEAPLL